MNVLTLLERVRNGEVPLVVAEAALAENVLPEKLAALVAEGAAVVCRNNARAAIRPLAVGRGLRTKVNANIGTSKDRCSVKTELQKLEKALEAKTDAVMDLSTGGDIRKIRKAILAACPKPLGTVPLYEMFARSAAAGCRDSLKLDANELFDVIEEQAEDGVDFMTIHCGITQVTLERLRRSERVTGIVSRGGSFIAAWMTMTGQENPLYEQFDRLLKICKKYDVTLSLGDGLRPGCAADAGDRPMLQEMLFLGELAARCTESGVQVVIEGPGHMPMDAIEANIKLEKSVCNGAPYYVLGPLVTDVAPGYDHITSAIGGAIAAAAGADFLCYVTPSEHLGLPGPEDVRAGVIAARIAAHAADIVKLKHTAWDREMSAARKALDWKTQERLALDPSRFDLFRHERKSKDGKSDKTCTMCGQFCAYEVDTKLRAGQE